MDQGGPLYRLKRMGFEFVVYANRIETQNLPAWIGGKRETIPLRNVANVGVANMGRQLTVTTNDGATRNFPLGGSAEQARQAILAHL